MLQRHFMWKRQENETGTDAKELVWGNCELEKGAS